MLYTLWEKVLKNPSGMFEAPAGVHHCLQVKLICGRRVHKHKSKRISAKTIF